MCVVVHLKVRVVRDRVLVTVGDRPPRIVGRIDRCPCCGHPRYVEA